MIFVFVLALIKYLDIIDTMNVEAATAYQITKNGVVTDTGYA